MAFDLPSWPLLMDLPLLLPRGHAPPGDPLGRVYTPQRLADAIVAGLPQPPKDGCVNITEPSVGGGAFARAARARWPDSWITGVDMDQTAPGLGICDERILGDWTHIGHEWIEDDIIVGNPPFGKAVGLDVTCQHVLRAIERARLVSLILPLPMLCSKTFEDKVLTRHPLARVSRILGRPWDRVREVAVFEWRRWHVGPTVVDTLEGW